MMPGIQVSQVFLLHSVPDKPQFKYQWASPVSRSFLHRLSQFINHGLSGALFLPNTGCVILRLLITIQTIEKIDSEER